MEPTTAQWRTGTVPVRLLRRCHLPSGALALPGETVTVEPEMATLLIDQRFAESATPPPMPERKMQTHPSMKKG